MNIRYAVHPDGFVVSFWGGKVYWPILDYEGMGPKNNYEMKYNWEKCDMLNLSHGEMGMLKFTKNIPPEYKNFHRKLWGMKPVKQNKREEKWKK